MTQPLNVKSGVSSDHAIFTALVLAWGTTWLAIKIGVSDGLVFGAAGIRFFIAGLILLAIVRLRGRQSLHIEREDRPQLAMLGFGVIGLTFGAIYWGEQYVSSGVAAVLVQGVIPVSMYGFSVLHGQAAFASRRAAGIAVGVVGLIVLFSDGVANVPNDGTSGRLVLAGMAAILLGTLVYCWGGVAIGPLLERYSPVTVAAYENVAGGLSLLAASLLLERDILVDPSQWLNRGFVGSTIFLIVIGSLVGFTAYSVLLGRWGASRVSIYAFLTPIVGLAVGVILGDETLTIATVVGTMIILVGVLIVRQLGDVDALIPEDEAG